MSSGNMQPPTDIIQPRQVIKIAIKKAGGLRSLCRVTGIARSTITRNRNNETITFRKATIRKLLDYVNG